MEELTKEELQAKYDSMLAEYNNLKKEKDSCFDSIDLYFTNVDI